jgi:hypothetical protein
VYLDDERRKKRYITELAELLCRTPHLSAS